MKQLHVTENKSNVKRPSSNNVRVFVDRDYHYGVWIEEYVLTSLLDDDQFDRYLSVEGDVKLEVSDEVAAKILELGNSPYKDQQ